MRKKIIKDIVNNLYWCGYSTDEQYRWSSDPLKANRYDSKSEAEDQIKRNVDDGKLVTIITVYETE